MSITPVDPDSGKTFASAAWGHENRKTAPSGNNSKANDTVADEVFKNAERLNAILDKYYAAFYTRRDAMDAIVGPGGSIAKGADKSQQTVDGRIS